jgi:cell division protein ZapA (FtsZ GTPase activity inhibitor)
VSQAVKVTIGGHELLVSSEHPAEYTRAVASYFDEALARIRTALPTVDAHRAAILAGLAVTDELFQTRQADATAANRIRAVTEDLTRLVPPVKRGPHARDAAGSGH